MNYKHLQEIVNIENKPIDYYTKNYKHHSCPDVNDYLTNKISYHLDVYKKKGMSLFLEKITH